MRKQGSTWGGGMSEEASGNPREEGACEKFIQLVKLGI